MKIELIKSSRCACALTVLVDRLTYRGRARHCSILGKLSPVFSLPPPPVQMVSNIYSFALFIKHSFGQTPVWLSCNRPTCENSMLQLEMRLTIVISFFLNLGWKTFLPQLRWHSPGKAQKRLRRTFLSSTNCAH